MRRPSASLALILFVSAIGGVGCAPAPVKVTSQTRRPWARPKLGAVVDATPLERKMLFGYQGWFLGHGDGSPVDGWTHWFRNDAPTAANLMVNLWPDTSELGADELVATDLAYADGSVAQLYSAYNPKTVARHFAWIKQAGIDGVALQRFLAEVQDPNFFAARNQVTRNVQAGAEAEGRVFAIEYDVSGVDEGTSWPGSRPTGSTWSTHSRSRRARATSRTAASRCCTCGASGSATAPERPPTPPD